MKTTFSCRSRRILMAGTGLATLTALALMAAPVFAGDVFAGDVLAQDAPAQDAAAPASDTAAAAGDAQEVVVVGVRKSLKSAQQIKRSADTVVDSITSEDIGSFPDKSVSEALQRVAGITVSRFNGTDDTAHFSAEPSGVLVDGLPQVRSEFNGRDTFSANSSRGLDWGDISPELMAGVDTYKNQTADMIEGGIAGSINLRTRLPFDNKGRLLVLSADSNYGDLAKKSGYDVSGIWSDRWSTSAGDFGLMANFATSQVYTGSQGIQYDRMGIFAPSVFGTTSNVYIPSVVYDHANVYDRNRKGVALAAQWRSTDGTLLVTGTYNRSQYRNAWQEHVISGSAFSFYGLPTTYVESDPSVVAPAIGTPAFTFDSNGMFTSGQMSTLTGYQDNDAASAANVASTGVDANGNAIPLFAICHSWDGCTTGQSRRGAQVQSQSNYLKNDEYTEDYSLNLKWDISDTLHANFDVQHVKSEVQNFNASVNMNTYGDFTVDATGKYPIMTLSDVHPEQVNLAAGGFTNAHNYNYYSASDHTEESEGEEDALRADVKWEIGSKWLDSLKVGVRVANRDQNLRWGAYNWANITSVWGNQSAVYNADGPSYPTGNTETFDFGGNFLRGGVLEGKTDYVFFNMNRLKSVADLGAALGHDAVVTPGGVKFSEYYPVCSGEGYRAAEVYTGEIGCYTPNEIHQVKEDTRAVYAMLKFGGPDVVIFNGIKLSGNIGVRVVATDNYSSGGITFDQPFTAQELICTRRQVPNDPNNLGGPTHEESTQGCVVSADEIAFNNGAEYPGLVKGSHSNTLPSLNLKFDLNDQWVMRFAYSKAMSRPDMGLLKAGISIGRIAPILDSTTNPAIHYDSNGHAIGYDYQYKFTAGNPYLKPMTADQYDITLEHYFASVGSFTATAFYKSFHDYITYGKYNLTLTNNGVTRTVEGNGPVNGDGAKIQGLELAYTRFFNFLPAPFDGLGIQANYTYVKNSGITNTNLVAESADGTTNTGGGGLSQATDSIDPHALQGVSKDTYNLILMYEKKSFSARIAYNWRSKFLVTAVDCCVGLPIWQMDTGYLDASFKYRLNDRVEFSLEGSNLLDTDTVLKQQVNNDGLLAPNAWFKNDRRVQAGVQFKF